MADDGAVLLVGVAHTVRRCLLSAAQSIIGMSGDGGDADLTRDEGEWAYSADGSGVERVDPGAAASQFASKSAAQRSKTQEWNANSFGSSTLGSVSLHAEREIERKRDQEQDQVEVDERRRRQAARGYSTPSSRESPHPPSPGL